MSISYQLRISKKAKYLQLRISTQGLFVIVPHKKPPSQKIIEDFIQLKKEWIQKKLSILQAIPKKILELPKHIDLQAFNQIWSVNYVKTIAPKLKCVANPHIHQITILGDISNQKQCVYLLKQWLKQIAEPFLTKELQYLSEKIQLTFSSVTIRNNSTRWGSCSSQKKISLCCKLLFLPIHLVHHVMLHELCHTRFMNHGKSFWKLLNYLDTDAFKHAKDLKIARKKIPFWAEANHSF